jgi:hypothetical protein
LAVRETTFSETDATLRERYYLAVVDPPKTDGYPANLVRILARRFSGVAGCFEFF